MLGDLISQRFTTINANEYFASNNKISNIIISILNILNFAANFRRTIPIIIKAAQHVVFSLCAHYFSRVPAAVSHITGK